MKKFLFLFSAIALLNSCSSDDYPTIGTIEKEDIKHKVTFDVQNESFDITSSTLKSMSSYHSLFQVRVYKESGEIYSQILLSNDDINNLLINDDESIGGAIPITLELPKGKYKVAFINRPSIDKNVETELEEEKQNVSNFYTDKIMMRVLGFDPHSGITHPNFRSNNGFHANVIDLSVSNDTVVQKVKIEPLWSDVELKLTNSSKYSFPAEVNKVAFDIVPAYANFTLHDLLAVDNFYGHYNKNLYDNAVPVSRLNGSDSFSYRYTISKTLPNNNNMKIIVYLLSEVGETTVLVDQYEIDLNKQVENGLSYVIKGDIKNLLSSKNSQLTVILGKINQSKVTIDF